MNNIAVYLTYNKENNNSKEIKINEYCISKKYNYDTYIDLIESKLDITNRKNFDKLKKEIENGKYDTVVIYGLDNVSRNNNYNVEFIDFLYKHNCRLECVDGTIIDKNIIGKIDEYLKMSREKKKGKIKMSKDEEKEIEEKESRYSINKFELEGNVGYIGDVFTNKNGKESLRFDLAQNNNGTTQYVPILLKGNLVNTYGSEIKKGDWLTVKGRISTYTKDVERDGKSFKEKVTDILGFEITDKNNNKTYYSNGDIEIDDNMKER